MSSVDDRIQYWITNECIESIVEPLEIQPKDRIVSVCGSLDIPAAMVEFTNENIFSFDRNLAQINLGYEKIEQLVKKNYKAFFAKDSRKVTGHPANKRYRDAYFKQPGRLSNISEKIKQIDLIHSDIIDLKPSEKFDIVYLSNIPVTREVTSTVNNLLINGGKIAITIFTYDKMRFYSPQNWELDIQATKKAFNLNNKKNIWTHLVYRINI